MNEYIKEMLEEKHNVIIKNGLFNYNDTQYGWLPIPHNWTVCEHCRDLQISDVPEIAENMLCDKCHEELNRPWDSDFIGYRKGE